MPETPADDLFRKTFSLESKRALVTGASSGIGAHLAGTLARAGAEVVLAARRAERLEAECARLAAVGARARPLVMDVADAGSVEAAFASLDAPLDILVHASGIAVAKAAAETSEDEWDAVLDTNLKGAFLVARAAVPLMRPAGGSIITIASILGTGVLKRVAAYAASKAGLVQLTRALALEHAREGIRVNAIAPGYIETDINRDFFATDAGARMIGKIPLGRLGQVEDLDGALLMLAGPAGRFVTGTVVTVDGGHLLAMG